MSRLAAAEANVLCAVAVVGDGPKHLPPAALAAAARELAPDDPDSVTVIATGGLASLVINEVSVIDAHEPWLTLIGLRLVFERNTTPEIGVPATDRPR